MSKRLLTAAALAAAIAATPALAQGNRVVATVDGKEITEAEVDFAYRNAFADVLGDMPEDAARERVLELLIDVNLMAEAARQAGMAATPDFAQRMAMTRLQALQERYMADLVERSVTDEAIRERFEALGAEGALDFANARHILVRTEEEASDILAELEAGGDFDALAAEHSLDPGTKDRGGSLGWFPRGQMVAPFEEAAFALEPGETTEEPVQSDFGFHIIRSDGKRTLTFEDVEGQIRERMIREVFAEAIDGLRREAVIERAAPAAPEEGAQ